MELVLSQNHSNRRGNGYLTVQ